MKARETSVAKTAPPPNREEVAAYVATFSRDLRDLARRAGLTTLAYLLDMAQIEAASAARGHDPLRPGGSEP